MAQKCKTPTLFLNDRYLSALAFDSEQFLNPYRSLNLLVILTIIFLHLMLRIILHMLKEYAQLSEAI